MSKQTKTETQTVETAEYNYKVVDLGPDSEIMFVEAEADGETVFESFVAAKQALLSLLQAQRDVWRTACQRVATMNSDAVDAEFGGYES